MPLPACGWAALPSTLGVNLKRFLALSGVSLGMAAIALPVIALPPGTESYNRAANSPNFCLADQGTANDDNSLVIRYPARLWPPNHKYFEDISVTADDGADGTVNLTTTGTHNQYTDTDTGEEQNGAGNTANDITVDEGESGAANTSSTAGVPAWDETGTNIVTTNWAVRAERSGHKSTAPAQGREYTLSGTAEYSDGSSCTGSVTIVVPHDMRKANR